MLAVIVTVAADHWGPFLCQPILSHRLISSFHIISHHLFHLIIYFIPSLISSFHLLSHHLFYPIPSLISIHLLFYHISSFISSHLLFHLIIYFIPSHHSISSFILSYLIIYFIPSLISSFHLLFHPISSSHLIIPPHLSSPPPYL